MAYVRLLNFKNHYSRELRRFKSYAFQDSEDGSGISVIDCDCAERASGGICVHCAKRYASVAGTPMLYWEIPQEIFRDHWSIAQDEADGDECHYNLKGVADREGKNIITKVKIEEVMICAEDGPRYMTDDDLN